MDVTASTHQPATARVLVVADWALDPHRVVAACRRRAATDAPVTFGLLVPAWLHGLDWVGDPYASRPCAARQLEELERLATLAGLDVAVAGIGDPDPASAVGDVREEFFPTEIMLCSRGRRPRGPFDLARRIRRAARLPVHEVAIRAAPGNGERRGWSVLRFGGRCAHDLPRTA